MLIPYSHIASKLHNPEDVGITSNCSNLTNPKFGYLILSDKFCVLVVM